MSGQARVAAQYDAMSQRVNVYLMQYVGEQGIQHLGQPVVFSEAPADGQQVAPTFWLRDDAAQQLVDQLWICGYRPSEGSGSAGSLAATEKHLADMRTIAFKALEIDPTPKAR